MGPWGPTLLPPPHTPASTAPHLKITALEQRYCGSGTGSIITAGGGEGRTCYKCRYLAPILDLLNKTLRGWDPILHFNKPQMILMHAQVGTTVLEPALSSSSSERIPSPVSANA